MSKTSPALAHRPLPTGILALFFVLTIVRFGIRLSPWFPTTFPGMEEQTDIIQHEQNDLENLLTPFGKLSASELVIDAEMDDTMCWESEFVGAEEARGAHEERLLGIEARKQARKQHRAEKHNLVQKTKDGFTMYFQERQEAQTQRRKEMNWAKVLPGRKQAQALHKETMQKLEDRKQMRKQSRLEKHALAQATKNGFAQYFEARKEMQIKRRERQSWANGLPGATQAQAQHEQQMQDFEARKEARKETRLGKRAITDSTKHGFLNYFHARKEAQLQRRRDSTWAQNLPGAEQAQLEHVQRMTQLEIGKRARKQRRYEKHAYDQMVQHGFAQYFQTRKEAQAQRRKDMIWAHGLPGAAQAQLDHELRVQDLESRSENRQQDRLDKRAFAKATKDEFAQYFQTRRDAQIQRRKITSWAHGLPGKKQAQIAHAHQMQNIATRKQLHEERRQKENNWANSLLGAKQAQGEHQQRIRELASRREQRRQTRLEMRSLAQATKDGFEKYFLARDNARLERRVNRSWTQNLPGLNQAELDHAQRFRDFASRREERKQSRLKKRSFAQATKDGFEQYFLARSNARLERQSNRSWTECLSGLKQAQLEHEQRMQHFEARKQTRKTERFERRAFAETTENNFTKYFETRKELYAQLRTEQNWAQGLFGAQQAQIQHQERMVDAYARKHERKQSRLENNAFAEETKAAFTQYFQDRKEGHARRSDQNWAQGLPGASEPQNRHAQTMKNLETRKLAREQARRMKHAK